jgi:hypothetical protein
MSLASQSQINLDAGETDRIIRDDEADREYIVEIVGPNDIRIDHNERYASDGTTLSAGQKHKVRRLRGQELYAAAFDGATALRVREAAADVESQPEKEVSLINADNLELAAAVGIQNSQGSDIDPATEQSLASQLPREVSAWSAGTVPVTPDGPDLPVSVANPSDLVVANQSAVSTFQLDVSAQTPLPSIAIPDGFELTIKADQTNNDKVLVDGTFPLERGAGLSLGVSNANVVNVEPASGTQTIYGIVEVN